MKIYFSHGKESGPWGTKIKHLAKIAESHDYAVESIDYSDTMDPDLRVECLLDRLVAEQDEYVLAGSSMGGYVSLVASETIKARAVFLMAPALYIPGYRRQQYRSLAPRIEIVHGWSDSVIPAENSIRYAREADCTLHLVEGDHALNTSLDMVASLFEGFLDRA